MTIIVITQNSTYMLDDTKKTWERKTTTPSSGHLRTESGVYDSIEALKVGCPMMLWCPPLSPASGAIARLIMSSNVKQIVRIWA